MLGQWPFYWECKRNQDGSFSARFKDVTDGRATDVWPIGLLEEGWNSDNVKVEDYRTSYILGKLRIMRRVVEEHIETDECTGDNYKSWIFRTQRTVLRFEREVYTQCYLFLETHFLVYHLRKLGNHLEN
jgi:hypothetical protein